MSNIGQFRHRMQIQSYSETQDATFKTVPKWTTLTTVYAEIQNAKGTVYFNGQQVESQVTHKITIRYQPNITSELWLMMESRRFRIRRVKDLLERHRFLELACEEVFEDFVDFVVDNNAVQDPLAQPLASVM